MGNEIKVIQLQTSPTEPLLFNEKRDETPPDC